jgi:hypothetical protein
MRRRALVEIVISLDNLIAGVFLHVYAVRFFILSRARRSHLILNSGYVVRSALTS